MSDISANGKKKSFKEKFKEEFIEYWINVAYLTFYFGVFVAYRRLILAHYEIDFEEYGTAFFNAFVLGKVVSIIGMTKMGKKNINTNLSLSTLYKTALFTFCLIFFNALEEFVIGYYKTSSFQEAITLLRHHVSSYEYIAHILIIFTCFIPFFAFKEMARVIGHKTMIDLFFKRKESVL